MRYGYGDPVKMADAAQIVEGKFDNVGKRELLVTTGRFGFEDISRHGDDDEENALADRVT